VNADLAPTAKVSAAGAAGAGSVVLCWLLSLFGVDVPAPVAAALATLLAAGAGYLTPDASTPARHRAADPGGG
jgi:hypothetical protein